MSMPKWFVQAQAEAAEFAAYAEQFEAESQERLERVEANLKKIRKTLMKG